MKVITTLTRPGVAHPMTVCIDRLIGVFAELGFSVAQGPEIETEYYNFDALNIPADHPARDMWDTFWLKELAEDGSRRLLRTHTSPVQIRHMKEHDAPYKIIAPGKVYRHEATDATHEAQFYQIEGLWIARDVSLADLRGVLLHVFKKLLGEDADIRFRPTYFPFVEPGVEIDVKFRGKWLEVMGAGMVHPKVLENCGVDPKTHQGFAFGGGIDRLLMLLYNVPDVRMLYSGDPRFVENC